MAAANYGILVQLSVATCNTRENDPEMREFDAMLRCNVHKHRTLWFDKIIFCVARKLNALSLLIIILLLLCIIFAYNLHRTQLLRLMFLCHQLHHQLKCVVSATDILCAPFRCSQMRLFFPHFTKIIYHTLRVGETKASNINSSDIIIE